MRVNVGERNVLLRRITPTTVAFPITALAVMTAVIVPKRVVHFQSILIVTVVRK